MDYVPIVRIVLRYVVGAGLIGSEQVGESLAANPDLVFVGSLAVGAGVEAFYVLSKRWGWST